MVIQVRYTVPGAGFPERANEAFTSWCKGAKKWSVSLFLPSIASQRGTGFEGFGISVVPLRDYVVVDLNQSVHNIEK